MKYSISKNISFLGYVIAFVFTLISIVYSINAYNFTGNVKFQNLLNISEIINECKTIIKYENRPKEPKTICWEKDTSKCNYLFVLDKTRSILNDNMTFEANLLSPSEISDFGTESLIPLHMMHFLYDENLVKDIGIAVYTDQNEKLHALGSDKNKSYTLRNWINNNQLEEIKEELKSIYSPDNAKTNFKLIFEGIVSEYVNGLKEKGVEIHILIFSDFFDDSGNLQNDIKEFKKLVRNICEKEEINSLRLFKYPGNSGNNAIDICSIINNNFSSKIQIVDCTEGDIKEKISYESIPAFVDINNIEVSYGYKSRLNHTASEFMLCFPEGDDCSIAMKFENSGKQSCSKGLDVFFTKKGSDENTSQTLSCGEKRYFSTIKDNSVCKITMYDDKNEWDKSGYLEITNFDKNCKIKYPIQFIPEIPPFTARLLLNLFALIAIALISLVSIWGVNIFNNSWKCSTETLNTLWFRGMLYLLLSVLLSFLVYIKINSLNENLFIWTWLIFGGFIIIRNYVIYCYEIQKDQHLIKHTSQRIVEKLHSKSKND
jgi:hypothetical protein